MFAGFIWVKRWPVWVFRLCRKARKRKKWMSICLSIIYGAKRIRKGTYKLLQSFGALFFWAVFGACMIGVIIFIETVYTPQIKCPVPIMTNKEIIEILKENIELKGNKDV